MTDELKTQSSREEVRKVLTRINVAWRNVRGEPLRAALQQCFADDAMMRGPDFAPLGQGREFAVQSYVDFVGKCQVKHFLMAEPEIDIIGGAAVAQYRWTMAYITNGSNQEYTERGHDVFFLSRETGRWLVLWRALLPDPA